MDLGSAFAQLHWLAVLTATVLAFVIGGLWYSPLLFGKGWMAENNLTPEIAGKRNQGLIFGASFILLLLAAIVLAMFLGGKATAVTGLAAGLLVGVGWLATSLGVLYLFEARSFRLFAINAGYLIVTFAVMGTILGAWH
jgi:hypothetical protein